MYVDWYQFILPVTCLVTCLCVVCVWWMLIGQQSDRHCCLLDTRLLVTMVLLAGFTAVAVSLIPILTTQSYSDFQMYVFLKNSVHINIYWERVWWWWWWYRTSMYSRISRSAYKLTPVFVAEITTKMQDPCISRLPNIKPMTFSILVIFERTFSR